MKTLPVAVLFFKSYEQYPLKHGTFQSLVARTAPSKRKVKAKGKVENGAMANN
jgi:hypothetical protein